MILIRFNLFQYLQYKWARKFPHKIFLAHNLSINLIISNSHDSSMYTVSMRYINQPIEICGNVYMYSLLIGSNTQILAEPILPLECLL